MANISVMEMILYVEPTVDNETWLDIIHQLKTKYPNHRIVIPSSLDEGQLKVGFGHPFKVTMHEI